MKIKFWDWIKKVMWKLKHKSKKTPYPKYWVQSLHDITYYEWEQIEITGALGRISEENYYHLCDLVCDLLGQKTKLKTKGKDLEVFAKKIIKYITDPNLTTQNDYEFAKAKFLFDSKPITHDSIMPFMFKNYGQIDKKKISLKDYLELYKALEKWQN